MQISQLERTGAAMYQPAGNLPTKSLFCPFAFAFFIIHSAFQIAVLTWQLPSLLNVDPLPSVDRK